MTRPKLLSFQSSAAYVAKTRGRVDLLGIDKQANIVVSELKRTEDGGKSIWAGKF